MLPRDHDSIGYTGDYRFLGLRGPLVIHGWGYDIYGKPVPNSGGDVNGVIDTDYIDHTDSFQSGWLHNPTGWPVAPVDLRYDRRRGVWTVPPAFRLIQIENTGTGIAALGTGYVSVMNPGDYYDSGGAIIQDPFIQLSNFTSGTVPSGERLLAYYDTHDGKYYPVSIPTTLSVIDTTGTCDPEATVIAYSGASKLDFRSGLVLSTGDFGATSFFVDAIPRLNIKGSGGGQSETPLEDYQISTGLNIVGTGFTLTHSNCVTTLTLDAIEGTGSGVKIKDTAFECDPPSVIAAYQDAEKLNFGSGPTCNGSRWRIYYSCYP